MLLAIDTSGPFCSAALLDEGGTIDARSDDIGRGHAEHLMGMISDLLKKHDIDWQNLNRIGCTTGPGSFTGLRVGLATARGLALALKCPCVGVSVFDAFHHGVHDPLAVVLDARRGQVWMQIYDNTPSSPLAVELDDVLKQIPQHVFHLTGSAASLVAQQRSGFEVISQDASPPIKAVAQLAAAIDPLDNKPKPLYLRGADAKPQRSAVIV